MLVSLIFGLYQQTIIDMAYEVLLNDWLYYVLVIFFHINKRINAEDTIICWGICNRTQIDI